MNSLDTNVVLRYFLNDVPEQTIKARNLIVNSACYITDVVATEIIFVLERVVSMERLDIERLMNMFLSLPNIVYSEYLLDDTIELYGKQSSLSFVDCYAATEAKIYKNKLITFDKALSKHGGDHVKGL